MEFQTISTFRVLKEDLIQKANDSYSQKLIDSSDLEKLKKTVKVACKQLENLTSEDRVECLISLTKNIKKIVKNEKINERFSESIKNEINKILPPSNNSDLNTGKVPSFKPIYCFTLEDQGKYEEFKKTWQDLGIKGVRIHFDDANKNFYMGHSGDEILGLASSFKELSKYFWEYGQKNLFNYFVPNIRVHRMDGVDLKQQLNTLCSKGEGFFNEHHFIRNECDLSALKDNYTDAKAIKELLGTSKGFVGEEHRSTSSKRFLIKNMDLLKKEGVTTLLLEHLYSETMQADLDDYFNHPDDPMPKALEAYLKRQDSGHLIQDNNYGFTALVKAAAKAGIRVLAIDTEASYKAGVEGTSGAQGPQRTLAFNYQAQEIIKNEQIEGKFVGLIGHSHVSLCNNVPGLSEILNCPNVMFVYGNPSVHLNVREWNWDEYETKNVMQGNFDILIERKDKTPSKENKAQIRIFSEWEKITHIPPGRLRVFENKTGEFALYVNLSNLDQIDEKTFLSIGKFIDRLNSKKIRAEIKVLDLSHTLFSGRMLFGTDLSLSKEEQEENIRKKIAPFSRVEKINLDDTKTSPSILMYLGKCFPLLKEISFDKCRNFNDLPIPNLIPPNLTLISIKGTPVKQIPDVHEKYPNLKITH